MTGDWKNLSGKPDLPIQDSSLAGSDSGRFRIPSITVLETAVGSFRMSLPVPAIQGLARRKRYGIDSCR
jgi:hypothetical protein